MAKDRSLRLEHDEVNSFVADYLRNVVGELPKHPVMIARSFSSFPEYEPEVEVALRSGITPRRRAEQVHRGELGVLCEARLEEDPLCRRKGAFINLVHSQKCITRESVHDSRFP